ncbi:LLM class flavin-dependent oxidoreductase [Vallicoccus soli]|uniref:LLM class flavin-dependent oxidoreductase n=1 Tax=Vallicoccus soli TaxID=2339232 RepID=A0A3A3YXG1_9ACTN|nr:LLM class flavin-dependent oxidoreductase [Vallicoccus soli]RJK96338.1 LLM class flavin-dependent oxidoreductase [Vallicoccus soli]
MGRDVPDLATVPLSVLELSPVLSDQTPHEALEATVDVARLAEDLGATRFWLAEHHGMPGIASSSPAVLLAHVAARTSTLRVGSGGVMLPNHAPLVVAEQFATLASLHPGRVDLGIGRAPGTDGATARALRRTASLGAEDFPEQLGELLGFLHGTFPEDHPYARLVLVPELASVEDAPQVWLLGSSGYSAQVAGLLGLRFAFAHHFAGQGTEEALALYRGTFRPSRHLDAPYAMVTATVVSAPTDEEARHVARTGQLAILRLRTGRPSRMPTPEEAAAHGWTELDLAIAEQASLGHVVGDPAAVRAGLDELVQRTAPDELMVTTLSGRPADRLRSLRTVAEVTGRLPAPAPVA